MDNKKITDQNQDESWFDDLLHQPKMDDEIGPDESAVASAGLSDISDLEFEKIMQEAMAEKNSPPENLAAEEAVLPPAEELPDEYADDGEPAPATEKENEAEDDEAEDEDDKEEVVGRVVVCGFAVQDKSRAKQSKSNNKKATFRFMTISLWKTDFFDKQSGKDTNEHTANGA